MVIGGLTIITPVNATLMDDAVAHLNIADVNRVTHGIFGFDLTALPDGRFAVVWTEAKDETQDGSGSTKGGAVYLQRYDRNGGAIGQNITVFEDVSGTVFPERPSVAADDQGHLIVAWTTVTDIQYLNAHHCTRGTTVVVRRVTGNTVYAVAAPDIASNEPCGIDVAMDADGDFALLWGYTNNAGTQQLNLQTYTAAGTKIASASPVSSAGNGHLAMQSDGRFFLAWAEPEAGDGSIIKAQLYNLQAQSINAPFRLDARSNASLPVQIKPNLTVTADGGLMGIWAEMDEPYSNTSGSDSSVLEIRGQRWSADGSTGAAMLFGRHQEQGSFRLDVSTPAIGTDSKGNVMAAWAFDTGTSDVLPSQAEATIMDSASQLVEERQFAYADYSWEDRNLKVGQEDIDAGRLAVSDEFSVIAWVEFDRRANPDRMKLNALVMPSLAENNRRIADQNLNVGGALGAPIIGLMLLLSLARHFRCCLRC
ncbi:hypothetical protein BGP77_01955 [Saccharospirillum sp. MSK14-1]|nr:hypothetical protein BGP77_01955 [Saccharospirillum sp. MSK14-1]